MEESEAVVVPTKDSSVPVLQSHVEGKASLVTLAVMTNFLLLVRITWTDGGDGDSIFL